MRNTAKTITEIKTPSLINKKNDDDNDDNYDNANPWVELTDQVQESLSELFDEQVQLYRQQGKSDIVLSFLGVNSIVPAL